MSIYMDGHQIESLVLKASNGSTVTKTLTEVNDTIPERTKWFRPPDMPDYDSIIDKSIFEYDEAGATYQANYFLTLSTRIPGRTTFDFRTYLFGTNDKVEYGLIQNGAFQKLGDISHVADGSNSFDLSALSNDYPFIVVHVVRNSETAPRWSFASEYGQTPPHSLSPVLEFYGKVSPFHLVNIENSPIQFNTMKYVTVWAKNASFGSASAGYRFAPPSIEVLDFSNADALTMRCPVAIGSLLSLIFPTTKVLSMNLPNLFMNNTNIKNIDLSNATGFVSTTMYGWFDKCISLETLNLSGIDMSAVTNTQYMFMGCVSLKNLILTGATLPGVSFSLSAATLLTVESLVAVMAALPTVSSATLTIGATNKAKLTEEQLAVATGKGWTVS